MSVVLTVASVFTLASTATAPDIGNPCSAKLG